MISVWGVTDQGIVRKNNQDACAYGCLTPKRAWGVVCDGMGGANAGDIASKMAIEVFQRHMEKLKETAPPFHHEGSVLVTAAEEANKAVFERSLSDADCDGMGTTLVGVLLWERILWIANVGDSRAYLIRKDEIRRLTRDHSVVEALVEMGQLTPEEARWHPQKNLITRALGTSPTVEADLFREALHRGDSVLLCSDGLVNVAEDQTILDEILAGGTPEEICKRLLEMALDNGAPDNVTIVLFQL